MEWFRIKRDIPFMRYALVFNVISLLTFLIAVPSAQQADLGRIREAMARLGFTEASVQNFGTSRDVLIRLPVKQGVTSAQLSERVMQELRKDDSRVEGRVGEC